MITVDQGRALYFKFDEYNVTRTILFEKENISTSRQTGKSSD
ncbi:MAG: hypothetical protein WA667_11950 [Candidatus Nitrosopolaris sp.]